MALAFAFGMSLLLARNSGWQFPPWGWALAVGALAAIMLGGVEFHIPEAITGLLGAVLP